MDVESQQPARPLGERAAEFLDRAETIYLRVLRATVLIIATLLILYTLYLAIGGLYRVAQSPDSVQVAAANVIAEDIVDAEEQPSDRPSPGAPKVADPAQQKFYADFVGRYYKLFQSKFEPFRQAADKPLSREEFDAKFVQSNARMLASANGEANFDTDRVDLEALLATVTTAATQPKVQARLAKYKAAKKTAVKHDVPKVRTEYSVVWNRYSLACEDWYENNGCAESRAQQVPYTETVTTMEFPAGTQTHAQIFHAMQDRYFSLLEQRRSDNAAAAERKREQIADGNIQGAMDLGFALRVFGGFLAIMFFFLLIAIERHQRRIAAVLPPAEEGEVA